jgi:F420-0:gamma-glutamyl ligase-like protein
MARLSVKAIIPMKVLPDVIGKVQLRHAFSTERSGGIDRPNVHGNIHPMVPAADFDWARSIEGKLHWKRFGR